MALIDLNIYGAGLFGSLLALESALHIDNVSPGSRVRLLDAGPEIINSWSSIKINNHLLNPGFHGLQLPRASKTWEILQKSVNSSQFAVIDDFKLLAIDGNLIPFRSALADWPEVLASGLINVFEKMQAGEKSPSNPHVSNYIDDLRSTKLFNILESISSRYSDNIIDSLHLLYPWFFPSEFLFDECDEGSLSQNSVVDGISASYYLLPKSGLFATVARTIHESLRASGVDIHLNHKISSRNFFESLSESSALQVWAASSNSLCNVLSAGIPSECHQNTRYIHLLLFDVEEESLNIFRGLFAKKPSEILCAVPEAPGLSRLSFPSSRIPLTDYYDTNLILGEYYSSSPHLKEAEIKSIVVTLQDIIRYPVKFIGAAKARRISVFNPSNFDLCTKHLTACMSGLNLHIPFSFWWPVNMAKTGHHVCSSIDGILSALRPI